MAHAARDGSKKKMQHMALEDAELRSLRIPSSAHRGAFSPSKNSFLPTLQEQAREDHVKQPAAASRRGGGSNKATPEADDDRRGQRSGTPPDTQDSKVRMDITAELLESVKEDFLDSGGALTREQFVRAMLRSLNSPSDNDPKAKSDKTTFGMAADDTEVMMQPSALSVREPVKGAGKTAAVADLFSRVDVHSEGSVSWEEVSNYLIEQGMSGGEEFTVDSIKTYEASQVLDMTKHESPVEKLVYLEQIDSVVCLSHNSRSFRLYDPKRCVVKNEVSGHRGTVINCCYVDAFSQIATTSADMTICFWDSHLSLRNRMAAKDVQLCLQWDGLSRNLFSGSIDGTLSRWDLSNMSLADSKKGSHKKAINDLLMVEDINLLASASSDGSILMWDTATMKPKKVFKGHKKGTFSLAYSMDYHCLLTAGLDQEALVWNPYVERVPIFRLKGHTHALCGVSIVPGTPQILSADVAGTFRLWDMRTFRCVQSFGGNETQVNDLNTFCCMPPHHRVAAGGNRVVLYDYMDEWGGESVTDTGGVTDALYNPNVGEFYTISKQTVKSWNANTGVLFKVLRDITKDEITAACLSDNGKKLYLGDAKGRVQAHGLNNGAVLTQFDKHPSDISGLSIWKGTNKVFSSSWDGTVKIHTDEGSRPAQVKAEFKNHRDGVTCLNCSPELLLLASGGMDMQVVLYDLKTMKFETALSRFQHVIADLDFLPKRCLLVVADQGGHVSFWRVRPHPDQWSCVFHFRNLPIINGLLPSVTEVPPPAQPVPVCALRVVDDGEGISRPWKTEEEEGIDEFEPPLLFTADTKGILRVWGIAQLCEKKGLHEVDVKELFDKQRSGKLVAANAVNRQPSGVWGHNHRSSTSHRISQTPSPLALPAATPAGATGMSGSFLTGLDLEAEPGSNRGYPSKGPSALAATIEGAAQRGYSPPDAEVQLIFEEDGHEEGGVASMYLTEEPGAIMTCGLDRRVRTWSSKFERLGTLLQSRDRYFNFPYDPNAARQAMLEEAAELLKRIGPLDVRTRLPALNPNGTRSPQETLLSLTTGGKGKPSKKKEADAPWKLTPEQVMGDVSNYPDEVDEDEHGMNLDQMERRLRGSKEEETLANRQAEEAQDRLIKHSRAKQANQMIHRGTALSKDEASAAERLARAMAALGGDDFGTYSAMAKSLRPRLRNDKAALDEDLG
eukprot:TRINITY_DN93038_c0_g1_i1.p1 TRINITY_DN93038_c0_g1~~TRINITY_DN93038_c0_g1_i1.p1  ORF type:complete len:1183 (+),score=279.83 TRINITY_DN93038_c0_g1_i1:19-3567(+)